MKQIVLLLTLLSTSISLYAMHRPTLKKGCAYLCIGWILTKHRGQVEEFATSRHIHVKFHEGSKRPEITQVLTNSPATLKEFLDQAQIKLRTDCSE